MEHHLKLFKESLQREFDQKRLELLENKDMRIKQMNDEIELEINKAIEAEKKRMQREKDTKIE